MDSKKDMINRGQSSSTATSQTNNTRSIDYDTLFLRPTTSKQQNRGQSSRDEVDYDADEKLARQLAEEEEALFRQQSQNNHNSLTQSTVDYDADEKLARMLAQEEEDRYLGSRDPHTFNRQLEARDPKKGRKKVYERKEYNPINYSNVVIHTKSSKKLAKQLGKKYKYVDVTADNDTDTSNSLTVARRLRDDRDVPKYPHVYDVMLDAKMTLTSLNNQKVYLPITSSRKSYNDYEEIKVEKMDKVNLVPEDKLVKIEENFDLIGRIAFSGCKTLNPMQSIVFETAYKTNKNMLVAAPTGSGKTNVAMMAVLNELRNWFLPETTNMIEPKISEKFKIIYIAPMKSLATEQTDNFSTRLKSFGIKTRELTGDMSMTEQEISQTHIIVTTPEKWDVVTRKSKGDINLLSLVRLLIIDEVHLLQSDRGPVLEAIVARTLRFVESSQKMTRIIGLSATLPNYIDVARFLCVNPYEGLFYFDNRFRPVPLTQTFIGVRPIDSNSQSKSMDKICYNLCLQYVTQSKQVMIFVHARNSTQRVAQKMRELINLNNKLELFQPNILDHPESAKAVNTCKNRLLKDLFNIGFGVHHAGMIRQDRLLVERLFRTGFLKVLISTATLAWGVNFPAHAVIIRGTEIYDASAGKFVDVGLLDVMQIFGRAGRPQYDTEGHAIIMTALDKMDTYLRLLTNQTPIESNFIKHLTDNLNAEVVSGTVSNVREGMEWLRYSYLNVRLAQNPLAYGYDHYQIESDPSLASIRSRLIVTAAKQLEEARMCRFDEETGTLAATDLGLIASHFYINFATVIKYNESLGDDLQPQDILRLIGIAQEFQQIKYREEEARELDHLRRKCYLPISGGIIESTEGKVSCLLQTYISRSYIETHSLISDLMYISQNATRIARGLFEYSLKRGWPTTTMNLLKVCKMLELQTWDFHTPFRHFDLPGEIIERIENSKIPIEQLEVMSDAEVAKMIYFPEKMAKTIKDHLKQLPYAIVEGEVKPVKSNLVRLNLTIKPYFKWNDRYHGKKHQSFWIWVADDQITKQIYYSEHIKLTKEQVQREQIQSLTINIPLVENTLEDGSMGERLPSEYTVYVLSDNWIGCDYEFPIDCRKIVLPEEIIGYTKIPENLRQLPLTVFGNENFAQIFRTSGYLAELQSLDGEEQQETHSCVQLNVDHLNIMQSQVFFGIFNRERNTLVCAPTGSGKTLLADLAALRVIKTRGSIHVKNKIVYVTPLESLARIKARDWQTRFGNVLQMRVELMTQHALENADVFDRADMIVSSAEKFLYWIEISEQDVSRVSLIILDDLHLVNDRRGEYLERLILKIHHLKNSKGLNHLRCRLIGLSNTISNPQDLARWLSVKRAGAYNFNAATSRFIQMEIHIMGFPERHYSPRMASMNKPIFEAIQTHSPSDPALVFVSSRKQCTVTSLDLVSCLVRHRPSQEKQWLHLNQSELGVLLSRVLDDDVKLALEFGIGILHPSLNYSDKKLVDELFRYGKIQVLICTTNYAWESDMRAKLIVVKGTEHYDPVSGRYVDYQPADVMQMLGRSGRSNIDHTGIAVLMVRDVYKEFYKKFLFEPFPIESELLKKL